MTISLYSRYHALERVAAAGRTSLASRPATPAPSYSDSLLHTVVSGETLDQLAFHYYGREDLWWRIADANPGRFPLEWQPGDVLVIPPVRVATRMPRR